MSPEVNPLSVTAIFITGNETDEQCKAIAWEMFCGAHPIEAYEQDAEAFWQYFHPRAPHLTREQMVAIIEECKAQPEES